MLILSTQATIFPCRSHRIRVATAVLRPDWFDCRGGNFTDLPARVANTVHVAPPKPDVPIRGLSGAEPIPGTLLKNLTTNAPKGQSAANVPVLPEGTPVELIAVDDFGTHGDRAGQAVTLVLAQGLTQSGKVLARAGDSASGLVNSSQHRKYSRRREEHCAARPDAPSGQRQSTPSQQSGSWRFDSCAI